MNNFQIEFKRLKADRGLSNKQIASFTGVKVKDVKQWEAGTSFPTDKKIINALEGLLGTEITQTLDGFSTEQLKDVGSLLTEESLFSIKNDDVQIKQTRIDKLRNTFQRKESTLNDLAIVNDLAPAVMPVDTAVPVILVEPVASLLMIV